MTSTELFALYFYQRARSGGITLFILPQTHNLLKRLEHLSRYIVIIRRFLEATQVSYPAQYFKRWAETFTRIWFHKGRRGSTRPGDVWNRYERRYFGHARSSNIRSTDDQPMEGTPRRNPKAIVEYAATP